MNSRKAEQLAISAVKDFFNRTDLIAPYLSENDKEPEWDGRLYLYNKEEQKNENLVGRIPVQVKSKQCKNFKEESISHSVSTVSLNNYLHDGGVLFFVVQVNKDNCTTKIFYRELAPIKIKGILNHKKGTNEDSVKFYPIGKDYHKIENRLRDFYYDCLYQKAFADKPIKSYKELQNIGYSKLVFHRTGKSEIDILKSIQEEPIYLYAENEAGALYPIGEDNYTIKFSHKRELITVGGDFGLDDEVFTHQYIKQYVNDKIIYKFADCFTIEMSIATDGSAKITKYIFCSKANMLSERIQQIEIIEKILEARRFTFKGVSYEIPSMNVDISKIQQDLDDLKSLKGSLDKLGVNKDLDMSKLSAEDERNLNMIVRSVWEGELLEINNPKTILCLKLSNLRLFLYIKQVNGLCKILSVFDADIVIGVARKKSETPRPSSIFTALSKEGYMIYDNIPYKRIVETYKEMVEYNPLLFEQANIDLLTILYAVDEMKERNDYRYNLSIEAALSLSKWLLDEAVRSDNITDEMLRINYLQVVCRMRNLSREERLHLIDITLNQNVPNFMKAGAYLLLGDKDFFDSFFSQLSNIEQKNFKTFPIYHLYKNIQ